MGLAAFARIISGFLGNVASPAMTAGDGARAVVSALLTAVIMLLLELLTARPRYRCTAKARQTLRGGIFSKVLELDVGNVEKIGPVSAITSSVDGVESMQVYYSSTCRACSTACWRLFTCSFSCWRVSLVPAVLLFLVSFLLLPVNNIFRRHIETLKTQYWFSMEDLTGYYLESVQGITTFKLFGRDGHRQAVLAEKSRNFNDRIMEVMKGELLLLSPHRWADLRGGGSFHLHRCRAASRGSHPIFQRADGAAAVLWIFSVRCGS